MQECARTNGRSFRAARVPVPTSNMISRPKWEDDNSDPMSGNGSRILWNAFDGSGSSGIEDRPAPMDGRTMTGPYDVHSSVAASSPFATENNYNQMYSGGERSSLNAHNTRR